VKEARKKKALRLAAPVAAGLLALAVQFLLLPEALPESGEYFFTELAMGQIGVVSIPLAMVSAFGFGFFGRMNPILVGFLMVAVFPFIAIYEATRFPGSHNLLPFELAVVSAWAVPLMLFAWLGRLAGGPGRGAHPVGGPGRAS
jgi:hypothetical protein